MKNRLNFSKTALLTLAASAMLFTSCCDCAPVQKGISERGEGVSIREYFLNYKGDSPVLLAHRMSPISGYGENSLVTLQYNIDNYPDAIQEIDVRITLDSIAVLNHDPSLERTSTGTGNLNSYTYEQLQQFTIKTLEGEVLTDKIPLLEDALNIVKGNGVVMLDMKPGTPPEVMMSVVERCDAFDDIIVICYSIEQGQYIYNNYPQVMIALGYRGAESIADYIEAGIPTDNIIALGAPDIKEASFYQPALDSHSPISFSAQVRMDRADNVLSAYRDAFATGITLLCTDSLANATKAFAKK